MKTQKSTVEDEVVYYAQMEQPKKSTSKRIGWTLAAIGGVLVVGFWTAVIVALINSPPENTNIITPVENPVESVEEESVSKNTVVLVAGQSNEYAEVLTLNKGTEFEETQYVYYLPAGTYTAKNVSIYPSQINVYSRETHINEAGREEPSETIFVKLLQVGESVEVSIKEDEYIEIHEPDILEMTKTDGDLPSPSSLPDISSINQTSNEQVNVYTFTLNTKTKVYHTSGCSAVTKITPDNIKMVTISATTRYQAELELIKDGYRVCEICGK